MQRYLISYEFTDGEDQEEGAEMLINWYESGGPQNRPENYEVHSWIFMVQNGIGHSVVSADSLETIWKQWHPWRRLMDISCLLYTSPSPRDKTVSRMPSSA